MKQNKSNELDNTILHLAGVTFYVIISAIGASITGFMAYQKYLAGKHEMVAFFATLTFMATLMGRWWLHWFFVGVKEIESNELSSKQRFIVNSCKAFIVLAAALPLVLVTQYEQLIIPCAVVVIILLLQILTALLAKIVPLEKIEYYTKIQFNGLSLMLIFFFSLAIAEYHYAKFLPGPAWLAFFPLFMYCCFISFLFALWVRCFLKVYDQMTELPELLKCKT